MSEEVLPPTGLIMDYSNMTPMPVIKYNTTSNALIFDNPVQTSSGIASSDQAPLAFNSPAKFNNGITALVNGDLSEFVPMPLPSDPTSLSIPAINSMGTIQATDLMIANGGVMKLYSDVSGTHVYGDITVDGDVINTNLQDQLNLKAPVDNPAFTGTVTGITKSMVGLNNVDNTSDVSKPVSTATQTALDLKANLDNPTFTGTITAPTINASTALQVNGSSIATLYQQRAWIMAIIPLATVNGPVTVSAQSGVATITSVNRTSAGVYAITWSPAAPNFNYIIQGNVRSTAGFVSFSGLTTSSCNLLTYNATGTLTDANFHFMIFRTI